MGDDWATALTRQRIGLTGVIALGATLAITTPAQAAVTAPHIVAVLYKTSGLELTSYAKNAPLTYKLTRNNVVIANGAAITDAAGDAAVNPGATAADCWIGATPQILPGDVVSVTQGASTDTMVVSNVDANAPTAGVTVTGKALTALGAPLTTVENRLVSKSTFASTGSRTLRQIASPDLTGKWSVTYSGLSGADTALALGAESRAVDGGGVTNVTISQTPGVAGPQAPCAAPLTANAVTSFAGVSAINAANAGAPLVVQGVAQPNATKVSVTVSSSGGGAPVTAAGTLSPGGTWTTAGLNVSGLLDGTLTAKATYTVPTGVGTATATITGVDKTIAKDVVAPPAPAASPSPGSYFTAQSISLTDGDPTATIHWTNNGAAPTSASALFDVPIAVTSSQTLSAVAVDPVGNVSPVGAFDFTIAPPPPPTLTPIVPAAPVLASALPQLGLNRLTTTSHVKRARAASQGLRLVLDVQAGTQVVKFGVYRKVKTGRKLIATGFRTSTGLAGELTVRLHDRRLRHLLTPGTFTIEVTPGRSQTDLGRLYGYVVHVV